MSWRYKGGFIQAFFDPLTPGPLTDRGLWSWGSGGNGVTGQGTTTNTSSPVQVGALTTWLATAAGS